MPQRAEPLVRMQHDVTRRLAKGGGADGALRAVLRALCEGGGWTCGRLFQPDEDGEAMRMTQAWCEDAPALAAFVERTRPLRFARDEGAIGRVWQAGEAMWMDNSSVDPRVRDNAHMREAGIQGALVFPVFSGQDVSAVISLSGQRERRLDAELRQAMLAIGRQVGQFLARTRAERELRDSEERFRLTVETITDHSIVTLDADGRVTTWNAGAQRIMGYPADEIVGAAYARFFPPEDCLQRLPERTLEQAARARLRLDGWRLRRSGERYWAEAVLHPLRPGGGPLRGYVEVLRDATATRAHLEALRESQARFSGILESAMDAVISIDDAQRIVLANAAAERLFGWPREALLGMPLARLLPASLRAAHVVQVAQYAEAGSDSRRMGGEKALRALRADGREFPIEASISRVILGRKRLLTVIVRDVTERLAAEEEIRRLNRELEARVEARTAELRKSVREMESFSYSISHDLRAPLRALDAFSTRLVRDHGRQLDTEAARLLERIRANARQMGGLVDALLTFARLGRVDLACNEVDMGTLAREAAALAQKEFPDARFVFGDLPPAWGDAGLLRQVWANLAHNAAKFSAKAAAPRIEVGSQSDREITYYLADNGAGFDPAYAGKLFGVFQRLHGVSEFEGTGAGLAIVKRILERHGGWIEARGRVGEGARFTFGLPGRENPASAGPN